MNNNIFTLWIVCLFILASIMDFSQGQPVRGMFYVFSAAINLTVLFMS